MLLFIYCHVQLLCNPKNCSPRGSSVLGISQARILERVAISFSRGSSRPRDWTHVSCIAGGFFFLPLNHQRKKVLVPQSCPTVCNSMDCSHPGSSFHRILQVRILECVPFPSTEDLPNPGIKPRSPALQADSSLSEPSGKPEPPETNLSLLNSCAFSVYWNIWPCWNDGDFKKYFPSVLPLFQILYLNWYTWS